MPVSEFIAEMGGKPQRHSAARLRQEGRQFGGWCICK